MLGSFAANLYTLIILHWVIYAVTTTILVVTLRSVLGEGAHVFSLSVFESYTVLHTMLTILMASTMGIPPFAGF